VTNNEQLTYISFCSGIEAATAAWHPPNLEYRTDGTANALLTPNGGRAGIGVGAIQQAMAVRRLLPEECEALQGFPRSYTNIPGAADGPRYRSLGNSMAVPVMAWIGRRIQEAYAND